VDHELDASQHTSKEQVYEIKGSCKIHVSFLFSFSPLSYNAIYR